MEKSGVLDPERFRPRLELRSEDQLGIQAEMSIPAVEQALAAAGRTEPTSTPSSSAAPTSSVPTPPSPD
ncbi:MAG: hypothetical protein R2710_14605 [Acidimicrobiales bacterium]